ncbi:MAG: hypothetical protein IPK61_13400 [Saprospiraceae bacterium]|nr:hypothetical protein [Saprospiraceae bacterium]
MKYIFISIFLINIISCGDDGPNCPGDMTLPVSINPYKPYYNIGDTITISSKFHKLLYDQKTEKYYDASGYRFSPIIELSSLDSMYGTFEGSQIQKFTYFIMCDSLGLDYIYTNNKSALAGEYSLIKDSIEIEVKLVLQKVGNFWIKISSLSSVTAIYRITICLIVGVDLSFNLESPKENNIHLMEKYRSIYPNEYYLSDSINRFYNHAGYCFQVR